MHIQRAVIELIPVPFIPRELRIGPYLCGQLGDEPGIDG